MKTLVHTSLIVLLSIGLGLETHFDGGEILERYEGFIASKTTEIVLQKAKNDPSRTVDILRAGYSSNRRHQELFTTKITHTYLIYKRNCCFLN